MLLLCGRTHSRGLSRATAAPPLSFQQFMQRGKVLTMYRRFMRLTKRVSDRAARRETRDWVRSGFERHRAETDPARIEVFLAQASRQYKELEAGVFSML
ncbi:LYR motif-containing protein 2 [Coemansia spiralis]|nr:LYR motif-containing protein 2 [Coemansia spiralis]